MPEQPKKQKTPAEQDQKKQTRAKARESAASQGKDWSSLSKDEKKGFRKAVRGPKPEKGA
jgi:hypothetical protein